MESFVDIHGRPVSRIDLAVGETKIVGLRKYNLTPFAEVGVVVRDSSIAFSHQCVHLGDPTKKKYIDVYNMDKVAEGNVPIEVSGKIFFQLGGRAAGHTDIDAFYALSRTITVTDKNPKLLVPPPAAGQTVGNFETMWQNHPRNPTNGPVAFPCNEGRAPLGHNQCFVRLCEALHKSGVSFKGCFGSSCQIKGADHAHHFSNPYDFPNWPWPKGKAYVWEAKPPFAPEPMPGLAAFEFVQQRQGIILFTHYFDVKGQTSMWGGHIDLWNRRNMGNNYNDPNPERGEGAFLRSRKISFWPLK